MENFINSEYLIGLNEKWYMDREYNIVIEEDLLNSIDDIFRELSEVRKPYKTIQISENYRIEILAKSIASNHRLIDCDPLDNEPIQRYEQRFDRTTIARIDNGLPYLIIDTLFE
jgi:hypothetical protein